MVAGAERSASNHDARAGAEGAPLPAWDAAGRASGFGSPLLRYTLCVTERCNLRCSYCYVEKSTRTMSPAVAQQAVDFVFARASGAATVDIGFFGGEPLLELPLLERLTELIHGHPRYDPARVGLGLTSNGTLFDDTVAAFLLENRIRLCISCDGRPDVHDRCRRSASGEGSGRDVERCLRRALEALPSLRVNAVYGPETLEDLPDTVAYLSSLGVRQIYLNPDVAASWSPEHAARLERIYGELGDLYLAWHRAGIPHFVSLIDVKLGVLARGGYHPLERCQMGGSELAIGPDGGLYPCERLFAASDPERHRIGSVGNGVERSPSAGVRGARQPANTECASCGLAGFCMNWCGCSNYLMTGDYDRVAAFQCASERAQCAVALRVLETGVREMGSVFLQRALGGRGCETRP